VTTTKIKIKTEGQMDHTIIGFCNMVGLGRNDSGSETAASDSNAEPSACNARTLVKLKTDLTGLT
jgi:hypothetical protein